MGTIKQTQSRLMSMGFPLPRYGADGDGGQDANQSTKRNQHGPQFQSMPNRSAEY